MDKTQKKSTVKEMKESLKELLRDNVVGFVWTEEESSFIFTLAGGNSFRISVEQAK
jgi:hypothetical protein